MIDQMLISMLSGVKWRVVAVLRPQRDEAEDALVVARAELEKRELHADRLEEEGVSVVEHAVRLLLRHVQLLVEQPVEVAVRVDEMSVLLEAVEAM